MDFVQKSLLQKRDFDIWYNRSQKLMKVFKDETLNPDNRLRAYDLSGRYLRMASNKAAQQLATAKAFFDSVKAVE